jgi:uncharacterized membrane protein
MPFCSQCGNQVGENDAFCGRCGSRQPVISGGARDTLSGITPRTAAILCYVPGIGWIASIVALAADKFRNNYLVRFHAFQGLYLFVAWLIEDWVLHPLFRGLPGMNIDRLLKAFLLFVSIFMMVKASREERYSLPIIGELAERSVAEN